MCDELVRKAARDIMEFIGADSKYASYAQVLTYIEQANPDTTAMLRVEKELCDLIHESATDIATLQAENEGLREALKKANTCDLNSDVQEIVDAALTQKGGE